MIKEKIKHITIGTRVEFDSDHGPQTGVVAEIKPDLGNGQRIAVVRVANTLDGAPWHMPVDQLQRAAAAA